MSDKDIIDDLSSISSTEDVPDVPVAYDDGPSPGGSQFRRRSSVRSLTSIPSLASSTNPLSRLSTGYSVRDIYGDMNEDDIEIRRIATRSTILTTLSHRARLAQGEIDKYLEEGDLESLKEEAKRGYDDIPDVSVPAKDFGGEFASIDPEMVTWEGEDDPEYPRNWSNRQRWFQTMIVGLYTLISPMSLSICSPAMEQIGIDLHMSSAFIKSFSVSVMVLAWALGPLIIAPISESDRVGRMPVLNFLIWIVAIFNLACGFAKTTVQLCVFRFLGGLGGCAALNVGAGSLADIWRDHERNKALGVYSIAPTLGPVIAPVISSFIVTDLSWHWLFFVLAIFNFATAVFGTIFFRETYSPRLLRIKANHLRKETGNQHLHTVYEIADGETYWGKMYVTVLRPLQLIVGHPMVTGLGAFMAVVYAMLYLMIVTFPMVFKGTYGFSVNISGLMYLSMGVGFALGTIFWCYMIDRVYDKIKHAKGGVDKPEYRLYCLVISGLGAPVGLAMYGWCAEYKVHWMATCVGAAIFSFFMVNVFQSIQLYLIQMNNRFAASSVAAAAVFRSCFGFGFPLFAHNLYEKLGYGWGNTLCALIILGLGVPFPVFCLKKGEKLRNWANKRFEAKQAKRDARNLERLRKTTN